MFRISYTEHKTNIEVMNIAKYKRTLKILITKRKTKYFGHLIWKNGFQRELLESKMDGKRDRGGPCYTWLNNIKYGMQISYVEMVRSAMDREDFRWCSAANRENL